ncbi:MAG: hypothetical protein P8176_08455 [Gammaproteobacteria bacterium]
MQITGEDLATVFFTVMIAGVLWMPTTWLLLSIFTPKKLLEKYFKEPHFSLAETILMARFPGFLIRTGIFAWLALRPSLDKKRNIKNVKAYMPRWYELALKSFMIGVIMTMTLFFGLMAILLLIPPESSS